MAQCQICGKNSGFYPICTEHMKMKETGEVIKNEETGKWELKKQQTNRDKKCKCIICKEETTKEYKLCKECYKTIQNRIEELDKNQRPQKLKDYYYNSKDYATKLYDNTKLDNQIITMTAIAFFT